MYMFSTTTKCSACMWTDLFVIHMFGNNGIVDEVMSNKCR